jgi:hypothetical protein
MTKNVYKRYSEDFKKVLSHCNKTEKLYLRYLKNMGSL